MPVISSNKPYRIGRSRTGLGLFATKPIKKGARIIRYFGPLLDSRKREHDEIENKYLFELNGRWTIDGSARKNIARYINHSCRPNAESDVRPRERKIYIRAIKDIEPGDEINYDYGTDYFKIFLKPIGCKCDSCERKRRKARAEVRAERGQTKVQAKARAGRKANEADAGAVTAKKKANGKSVRSKSVSNKSVSSKAASGKAVKGKAVNSKAANGMLTHQRSSSARPRQEMAG